MRKRVLKAKHTYFFLTIAAICFSVFTNYAYSLPIDWHGVLGVDTNTIKNFRRTSDPSVTASTGSQVINPAQGQKNTASFQSYLFRLNPSIIVNDSVSVLGEMTTGYGRGGFLGDSSSNRAGNDRTFGNALYFYNTSSETANLVFSKFYMELYSDIATYIIGRQSPHWGLGAILNEGSDVWDRHTTVQDGVTLKFKIGNFYIAPHYAKINSPSELTAATNVKDIGISLLYDNPERDLAFGVYYTKRKGAPQNTYYQSVTTGLPIEETSVKLTDIYLKKTFGKFTFSTEVPIISGELGKVFDSNIVTKYRSNAFIFETLFEASESLKFGLNAGHVSGTDGSTSRFSAIYLNPNYKMANLLFRYNLHAVSDSSQNVWDSYITNSRYVKFFAEYIHESWTWNAAVIYALADETAAPGASFDHTRNERFTATQSQKDDLGIEVDFTIDYAWNTNVTIGAELGYLFVGKYFEFTNSSSTIKAKNSYMGLVRAAVSF